MSLEQAINDVHALTASAIKLGAIQERDRIIGILQRELANPLMGPRELVAKIMEGIEIE
jgi:hypothetical protein